MLISVVRNSNQFSEKIKKEIEAMKLSFEMIDKDVAAELAQALQLPQIGKVENAFEDLVKIIEHLLSKKSEKDIGFTKWLKYQRKSYDLFTMHDNSKAIKIISEVEYSFFNAILIGRNKKDHEVNLKWLGLITTPGVLIGIFGVLKISSLLYKSNNY